MKIKNKFFIIYFFVIIFLFRVFSFSSALKEDCNTLEECQQLLEEYEREIAKYEQDIRRTQQEKNTLQNKIYYLRQKINKLNLQINESSLIIKNLSFQIKDTEESIQKTTTQIEERKKELINVLRVFYEQDQKSSFEILLSTDDLSQFFDNLVYLENLSKSHKEILADIKQLKKDLEGQKLVLDAEKQEWENMLKIQILQKEENLRTKQEQEYLLEITKGKESEYQRLLAQKKAEAQRIRQRIFQLVGVSQAPTFGEAVEIAKYVEQITGVRPAFLLAVLTQESNIGKNVGQCYLKDSKSGAGVVASTGQYRARVMNPYRDVPCFLQICKETGRDPYHTLVSCPMSFGWGGAMGPAQFIPSTWMLYKDRVKAITGRPADPWNIKDAFLAAGLYLSDYGASRQTYQAEWRAAMIYFSGSTSSRYRFYGDSVMAWAQKYEGEIEQIERFAYRY